jgi:hypothetical protein
MATTSFFSRPNSDRRRNHTIRREPQERHAPAGSDRGNPGAWLKEFFPLPGRLERPPAPAAGVCPSCETAVAGMRKIGSWGSGFSEEPPQTGAIYEAECGSCNTILTATAPEGADERDMEWRVGR